MYYFHILDFVLLIYKETIYIALITEELYISNMQMFINKLIYKTSNFKEKKDRFFTVCVSFKIISRHTNTMIEYKYWIPYQIVEKVTTFSIRKK